MEHLWLYQFKRRIIAGLIGILLGSTILSMLYITMMTRDYLLKNSAASTHELAGSISSSLRTLMLRRSPEEIQNTVNLLGQSNHIVKIFILNREGRVAFSSDMAENGKQLSMTDESCRVCHTAPAVAPASTTSIFSTATGDVQRNVTVMYNDRACFGCHLPEEKINGKLIIDYSLASTYTLINRIRFVILASTLLCLFIIILAIPYLSRSINRYIDQVVFKSNEISMIYTIIESVSKSIDLEDLKNITVDIVGRIFSSDEVIIVLPLRDGHYRIVSRSGIDGDRRKVSGKSCMLAAAIARWQRGELHEKEVSADAATVYLPISKGGVPLALIEICSHDNPFPEDKLRFMDSVLNPIAIAFENARLYTIAITDELTGLYTVRHFRTCLDRQRDLFDKHGEKFALLLIDLDNFKSVNDDYGHTVGDSVLKEVSRAIAEAVRESDQTFRYGGEEFAVLLPNTGRTGGLLVANRILSMVEETVVEAGDVQIRRTASIGLALFPGNADVLRDLVVEADSALYAAKRSGKNRVVCSEKVAGS